ncbi:hypothetical protein [Georgenia alba]|uniref:Integral membrane protein n=1 Tax=Georgenia alba TaxID=2233858 RepID=A0ABW2QDY4_9MICO
MLDNPVYVTAIILALLAVGELVSIVTKAYVPSLLVAFLGYLGLIWTGVLPPSLVPESALATAGSVVVGAVITHMGTLIPARQIREQWKAILIALAGAVLAAGLLLAVITPIFGYATAVAGTGPVTGGIIAYVLTAEGLAARGLDDLVVIPALVLGLQSLVGMPLANVLLRRYAVRFRDAGAGSAGGHGGAPPVTMLPDDAGALRTAAAAGTSRTSLAAPRRPLALPERFSEPTILLLLLFVGSAVATFLDGLTGLNYGIYCLLIGLGGQLLGIFPERSMEKANSFGIGMIAVVVVVLASMSEVTFADVTRAFVPVLVILVVGSVGIMIGGALVSRLLGWDPYRGMPVALTALFGFPGDYLLCQEIARSVGRDEDERKAILDEILTPMLVGGFATVTTSSIVIASILVGTI